MKLTDLLVLVVSVSVLGVGICACWTKILFEVERVLEVTLFVVSFSFNQS